MVHIVFWNFCFHCCKLLQYTWFLFLPDEDIHELQKQRMYVTPGLTCYWQVQPRRNEISFDEWMALDLKYIQERSFWVDWKIIFKTFLAVFNKEGE